MKKSTLLLALLALSAVPLLSIAQSGDEFTPGPLPGPIGSFSFFPEIVRKTFDVILDIMWVVFSGIAIIMFVAAGYLYVTAKGDPSKVRDANKAVLWGLVGVAVAVLAFSLPFLVKTEVENLAQ